MVLGIVGSEGAKFTAEMELKARSTIAQLIEEYSAETVVSGACHLGGIDEWAIHEASGVGCKTREFPPKTRNWAGYKARNIQIAETSDVVVCITVKDLPPGFKEGGWERYCYHCRTEAHVKSGGCWTVKYARTLGKYAYVITLGVRSDLSSPSPDPVIG